MRKPLSGPHGFSLRRCRGKQGGRIGVIPGLKYAISLSGVHATAARRAAPVSSSGTRGAKMENSPLTLVSIVRQREDGAYGTLDPVEAGSLSDDLRVRCLEAIERYQAEHGSAPNTLVIETTGNILASYQTG
jgi:hypothetical protein